MSDLLRTTAIDLFIVLVAMLGGVARAEMGDIGPVEAHSATKVTVKKGDRVTLEVKLSKDSNVKIKWASGDLTLCEKPSCLLVTEHYSTGRYPLILTVTQGVEQFVIPYEITVVPMPIGGRPRHVIVDMENAGKDLLRVSSSMFVAKPVLGRGFREDGEGLEAMVPEWRPLTWSERLKTHPEASVVFGLPRHEHHVLGEKTDVWLAQVKDEQDGDHAQALAPTGTEGAISGGVQERLIILLEGTLRSRQLDHLSPHWTVLIPRLRSARRGEPLADQASQAGQMFQTWLQVKGDKQGDILVVRQRHKSQAETVHIFVLRGTAQVTRTQCDPDFEECRTKNTWDGIRLQAGTSITLGTDRDDEWGQGDAPWLTVPDPRIFEPAFAETTPQYRPGEDPRRFGPGWTLRGQEVARTKELAIANAQTALVQGDWLVALEEIYPFALLLGDKASLILGRAYTGLALPTYAKQYLAMSMQFQRENPEPHLLLAHLALSRLRWKEAAKHLASYDQLGGRDGPWISYYQGVVAGRLGEQRFARREMLSTVRQVQNDTPGEAAQLFIDTIDHDTVFTSSVMTGVFYDSRVLRSKVNQELRSGSEALRVDRAGGAQFSLVCQLRGYQGPEAELKVEGLLDGKIFFDERLRDLNPSHPEIALGFALQPGGGGRHEPWLRSEMRPFLGTRVLGQHRALDEIGADLAVKSPRLQHVTLGMRSLMSKDPSPRYDDLIEPSLRELVPPDDQSHHDVRYWTGVRLYEDRSIKVAGELTRSEYRYDGKTRKFESFTTQEMALRGEHALWPYHDLRWDLSFLRRSFDLSEDRRRDLDLNLALSWSFSQTPLVSHLFGVGYEKQRSTRATQDFSRETAQYQMRFDF